MPDLVQDLYQSRAYPATSHPSTDPAVTAVAAQLAGLDICPPSGARILEIGCASGHNLLPLAARWPESRFTGIDFSRTSIDDARETARLAGLTNVDFIGTDIRTFDPGAGAAYDYIIAHGVYSWVPFDARQALLDFCGTRLAEKGLAVISYNTLPGWSLRNSVVGLTKLLSTRPVNESIGRDPERILGFLAAAAGNHTPYSRHLTGVLHDMFGKGESVLSFDEFSPVNEPCTFLDFAGHAARSGLRYLGESELTNNFPAALAPEAAEMLKPLENDPLTLQQTIDVLTNRTFRSSLLCRADAPTRERISMATVLDFAVWCPHATVRDAGGVLLQDRSGNELVRFENPLAVAFFSLLEETKPEAVPIHDVLGMLAAILADTWNPAQGPPALARLLMNSARQGHVQLRHEPVRFDASPPAFPDLGMLRLLAAGKKRPIVDIYHTAHVLNDMRARLARAMDGSRSVADLSDLARSIGADIDVEAWVSNLASRGMFTA